MNKITEKEIEKAADEYSSKLKTVYSIREVDEAFKAGVAWALLSLSKERDSIKEPKEMIGHFELFLDKHECRERFLDNLYKRGTYSSIEELIKVNMSSLDSHPGLLFSTPSFIWRCTPEGFNFWNWVRDEWVIYINEITGESTMESPTEHNGQE